MIVEDLAAVDEINEDKVMHILHERYNRGFYYTYIGDILVFLNPDQPINIYGNKVNQFSTTAFSLQDAYLRLIYRHR